MIILGHSRPIKSLFYRTHCLFFFFKQPQIHTVPKTDGNETPQTVEDSLLAMAPCCLGTFLLGLRDQ